MPQTEKAECKGDDEPLDLLTYRTEPRSISSLNNKHSLAITKTNLERTSLVIHPTGRSKLLSSFQIMQILFHFARLNLY
jgi:hypothetical protein